jgi:hypothetical protein
MREIGAIMARLREAAELPALLAVGFDAFEAIRILARGAEDAVPALFAAFMTAADAAVDGREAITIAPSLPSAHAGGLPADREPGASDSIENVTGTLAVLGELLDGHFTDAAACASLPGDRAACQEAAAAARQIHLLMAGHGDDGRLR